MAGWVRTTLLRVYAQTPEHPSKYRIVRWLGRHVFPEEGILCRAYPNIRLYLHPRDWIEYLLLRGERYEPLTLTFVESNLRAGDLAILAGVNFGLHVAVAARAVGEQGLVIGIEPQPAALLRASQNLRLNNLLHRVRLVSVALGGHEELAHMAWAASASPGTASLLDEGPGLSVSVLPLSRIVKTLESQKVRLLLLDVQGYESQALAGLDEDCRPEILVVEIDPAFLAKANTDSAALLRKIVDLGYSLHSLDGTRATPDCKSLPERNVICLREDAQVSWPRLPGGASQSRLARSRYTRG
jgi:FkbM family methyltransferase